VVGQRIKICGPLRIDRPYYVYTIQPDHAEEVQVTGTCEAIPKEKNEVLRMLSQTSCENLSSLDLFKQIAIVDSLADQKTSPELTASLEKASECMSHKVWEALSTNGEVYDKILAMAPSLKEKMKIPPAVQTKREDRPVRNTIQDLIQYWTD